MKYSLSTIHALAMQIASYKQSTIRRVLESIEYSSIDSFIELRELIQHKSLSEYYPDEKSWNEALNTIEKNEKYGIISLDIKSELYPKYLRLIDDAPNILHLRGNIDCLKKLPGIAVVGSRKVTENGIIIAQRISSFIAENDWVVVSGLALGIDAEAHRGALSVDKESTTIAVLAHGLEEAKPAKNRMLGYEILERGGLWVSEHRIGVNPKPHYFVARNRIQLGLSAGSIIVEAAPSSGSITQAQFCHKQKRPLFAVVPHLASNPLGLLSSGTELIVRDLGAMPLKTKNDYPQMLARFDRQRELMKSI